MLKLWSDMCCLYRMRSDLLSLISTALFMALNTEGSEMCFNYINCNENGRKQSVNAPDKHR